MTLSKIFHSQSRTISWAAGLLFISMLLSTILGLVRDGLLSWRFGAGETTDVYLAAFRIPDFLSTLFVMGGISVVFLPLFSEYFQRGSKEAWRFANNLLNIVGITLIVLAILAFLFAPFLIPFVAPGFSATARADTVALARLMLLSPILFGTSAIFSGVLQYFQKFLAYSLAPILYNLGIIVGILFLYPLMGILGLGFGVLLGAVLHLGIQIPIAIQSGFRWQPILVFSHPSIIKSLGLALPRTVAAVGHHINLLVVTALASTISVGSITIFNFANNLQHIPATLIGVSFALASFPALSKLFAERNGHVFYETFSRTLRHIIFFVLPASVLFFLLRAQTVRLIYGAGEKFGWEATRLTAAALGVFAFGILFYALLPFLIRTFFAMQDTKTPTIASLLAVGLNIILAFFLLDVLAYSNAFRDFMAGVLKLKDLGDIRILALPFALVISGMTQCLLLFFLLLRKTHLVLSADLISFAAKTVAASLALCAVTYMILQIYGGIFELRTYKEVLGQMLLASLGGVFAYFVVSLLFNSSEALSLKNLIYAAFLTKKK